MANWNRDGALLGMTSPLGHDTLIPIALSAQEWISQPFQFQVHVICQHGVIDPDSLLRHPACVMLRSTAGETVRYFHGIVQELVDGGPITLPGGLRYQSYQVRLVPLLWFLSQTVDCRVYQKLTVVAILQKLFQDAGLTGFSLPPPGAVREYTVQFNESDLHFATRLMEEEGYHYFFEHTAANHRLVVTNQNAAFTDIPGGVLHLTGGASEVTLVSAFQKLAATARGKMKFKDYDPTKPDTLLQSEQPTVLTTSGASQRDHFRWPALTFDTGSVADRAKREMEAAEAAVSLYEGASEFGKLVPGGKFNLLSKPANPYDGNYAIRSVSHHAIDDNLFGASGASGYSNRFTAFPSKVTWRQPLITPRPRMDGIHTALVLGPAGEEIYVDEYARVKVQFYWDHRQEATADQAVWTRVIQPWAGNGWGAQFIPRVGTEVAVAFVDGDPDRPIIIGGLYNGRDTPIYSVSDKTKSGFRTRSSLRGSSSQFNELTFDDKTGSELIFTHAQKDLTTEVEHDETLQVDHNRTKTVGDNESSTIGANRTEQVGQNESVSIGASRTESVGQNESVSIGISRTHTVGATDVLTVGAARAVTVGANQAVTIGSNSSHSVGQALQVQAGEQIILQTGSASIKMSKNGDIVIEGANITIKASGDLVLKGSTIAQN